jgi:hypothetical protein
MSEVIKVVATSKIIYDLLNSKEAFNGNPF